MVIQRTYIVTYKLILIKYIKVLDLRCAYVYSKGVPNKKEVFIIFLNVIDIPKDEAKEISKLDRENLKGCEVVPDDEFLTGKQRRIKPKACYSEAFRYMADRGDNSKIRLVHGLYKPATLDVHAGHAWVEIDEDIIFDGVLQRFYDKSGYFDYYNAIEERKYNCKEMYKKGLDHGGHYGPWH